MHIFIVEDDPSIVNALEALLRSEGYRITTASRQDEAIRLIENREFDLMLLDIALAQGSGFAVCAAARKLASNMPIIFLTASDDEFSTVTGLDMGATDYIAKPFRARELLARINAALRRSHVEGGEFGHLSLGDVDVDTSTATVRKAGREITLSALEYRLLLTFVQSKGRLVSRDAVRDALWDSGGDYVTDNAITVYVKRLREKIEDDATQPRLIETVRGLGYKAKDV